VLHFRQRTLRGPHTALHVGHRMGPLLVADYDNLLPHPHTRPVLVHTGLQYHGLGVAAAAGNLLLRVAVAGSNYPAGAGAGSHKGFVPGTESHRVAVDPCTGGVVVVVERRDLVDSSHLGRVIVDLAGHRQGQNHRMAVDAAAAAALAGLEARRNPAVGRPGVEGNRSSRFQTLSKVYRGKIVLFDRLIGNERQEFSLEERRREGFV